MKTIFRTQALGSTDKLYSFAYRSGLALSGLIFLAGQWGCAPRTPIRKVAAAPVVAKPPPQPKIEPKKKLLPICPEEDKSGATLYNPARVKLTIVNPDPDACDVELKVLEVPRQPCRTVTRKSATELAKPVFDLFKKLSAKAFLKLTVANSKAFLKARTAMEIPTDFEVQVTERWKFSGLSDQTQSAVAKRALIALQERESKSRPTKQPTGMVCVDLSLIKTASDEKPLTGKFAFTKSELMKLNFRQVGTKPRAAAVSLERGNGLASTLARFSFSSPLTIQRDTRAFSKILQNQSTSDCVWTLSAKSPGDVSGQKDFRLPVPRDGGLLASRFLRVRVAKEGEGILGRPVVVKSKITMKDFPPSKVSTPRAPIKPAPPKSQNSPNETLF